VASTFVFSVQQFVPFCISNKVGKILSCINNKPDFKYYRSSGLDPSILSYFKILNNNNGYISHLFYIFILTIATNPSNFSSGPSNFIEFYCICPYFFGLLSIRYSWYRSHAAV